MEKRCNIHGWCIQHQAMLCIASATSCSVENPDHHLHKMMVVETGKIWQLYCLPMRKVHDTLKHFKLGENLVCFAQARQLMTRTNST